MSQDNRAVANALARLFIARTDVRAIQRPTGAWMPETEGDGYAKWDRQALEDHIAGVRTYGHYLLSAKSQVKLFALDVDLNKLDPSKPEVKYFWSDDQEDREYDPRVEWANRRSPARPFIKYKMRTLAHLLAIQVEDTLGIKAAVAYSGSKGFHVYGFTGLVDASEAREAAQIVLLSTMRWQPTKGDNFYQDATGDSGVPVMNFDEFTIEVFPKQNTIDEGGFGNLMRLPLGRNLKSPDPTFFIDMTAPMSELKPVDPLHALTGDIWKEPGE